LSEKLKKLNEKREIKNILITIFSELKTEVTLPIKLLGTLLNKYVVLTILTPALVIPRTRFPKKNTQRNL
jgi:hypothetical protein